LLMSIKI